MSSIGPALPAHLLNQSAGPSNDGNESDEEPVVAGPQNPTATVQKPPLDDDSDDDDYAPALPPDMIASSSKKVVGPTMPPSYSATYDSRVQYHNPDDSDDDVGPKPLPAGVGFAERDAVKEFMAKEEKRRREVEVSAFLLFMVGFLQRGAGSGKTQSA